MVKNSSIHIKLETEIKEQLKQKAKEKGISLTAYCTLKLKYGRDPDLRKIFLD